MLTMTPQARAVAAFTLAVLLVMGDLYRLVYTVYGIFGDTVPADEPGRLVVGLLAVAVAAGVLWFAHLAATSADAGWHVNLAQAARVLALVGVAVAVFGTIGIFTADNGAHFPLYF